MNKDRRDTAYQKSTGTGESYRQPEEKTFKDASHLHPVFLGPFVQKVGIESEEAAELVAHLGSPEARSVALIADESSDPKISVMVSGVSVDRSLNITAILTDLNLASQEDVKRTIAEIENRARAAGDTSVQAAFFVDEADKVDPLFRSYDLTIRNNVDVRYLIYSKTLPPLAD